jgi:hypothetical protein
LLLLPLPLPPHRPGCGGVWQALGAECWVLKTALLLAGVLRVVGSNEPGVQIDPAAEIKKFVNDQPQHLLLRMGAQTKAS